MSVSNLRCFSSLPYYVFPYLDFSDRNTPSWSALEEAQSGSLKRIEASERIKSTERLNLMDIYVEHDRLLSVEGSTPSQADSTAALQTHAAGSDVEAGEGPLVHCT
ncbi:hypothetical protein NQZ68_027225 [Dissostichus eleginoides]|nr:hypothetical protein NQZ68_027225 [Dissostichus eleginoides]